MQDFTKISDKELSVSLWQGDEKAYVEIVRRHWKIMYNTAYKRINDQQLSEDIVQNIFVDLWERRGNVLIENILAYLLTAVRFQVLKHYKRLPRVKEIVEELEIINHSSDGAYNRVVDKELLQLVKTWIDALPDKRREIFNMHFFEDLSTRQIANELGIAQKTVQNQIHTASKMLKLKWTRILLMVIAGILEK